MFSSPNIQLLRIVAEELEESAKIFRVVCFMRNTAVGLMKSAGEAINIVTTSARLMPHPVPSSPHPARFVRRRVFSKLPSDAM